jgi:hypothetical protein
VRVVADDRERVPARQVVARRDRAVAADVVPAGVDGGGGEQHARLGDGGVHGHQVAVVDAEVGA